MKILLHIFIIIVVLALFCAVTFADVPAQAIRTTDKHDICSARTGTIRHIEQSERIQAFKNAGIDLKESDEYEWDHRISLTVGGSNHISNMMLQSYRNRCNAHDKDKLEVRLHSLICHDKVAVIEAQEALYNRWKDGFKKYVDTKGCE